MKKRPTSNPIKVRTGEKVVLLSGGNPQIAKADGDAPPGSMGQASLIIRPDAFVPLCPPGAAPWFGDPLQGSLLSLMMALQADELQHPFLAILVLPVHRGQTADPVRLGALFLRDHLDEHVLSRSVLGEAQPT